MVLIQPKIPQVARLSHRGSDADVVLIDDMWSSGRFITMPRQVYSQEVVVG